MANPNNNLTEEELNERAAQIVANDLLYSFTDWSGNQVDLTPGITLASAFVEACESFRGGAILYLSVRRNQKSLKLDNGKTLSDL